MAPILLGGGIPSLPEPSRRVGLKLGGTRSLGSDVIQLVHDVRR